MQQQQLSVHQDVDGFAYGFYQRTRKDMETYSHGGDMLGYSSFISLIPEKKIGVFVAHHHEGTSLRNKVIDAVLKYYGNTSSDQKAKTLNEGEDLSIFEGEYLWSTYCHTCPKEGTKKGRKLIVNDDNTLSGFGRKFYQIGPLLFKSFDGQRTMGFVKNEKGEIEYMSLGNINTLRK